MPVDSTFPSALQPSGASNATASRVSAPDAHIRVSYDSGLEIQLVTHGPMPEKLQPALEKYREVQWMPPLESLSVLVESLESAGAHLELSPEAVALQVLSLEVEQEDDLIDGWVEQKSGPKLLNLRNKLAPHQEKGAAFLAYRRRAVLADPPALEPIVTAIAGCELARRLKPGAQVVVLAPESRHRQWMDAIRHLTGTHATDGHTLKGRRGEDIVVSTPYLIMVPEIFAHRRLDFLTLAPGIILLDEATRYADPENRVLEAIQKLNPPRVFLVTPADVFEKPLALHSLIRLLHPVLAGPYRLWSERYFVGAGKSVGKSAGKGSGKGEEQVIHQGELWLRLAAFVLRRTPEEVGTKGIRVRQEARFVPLTPSQRTQYDRALHSLEPLIEARRLAPLEKLPPRVLKAANDALLALRASPNSLALFHESRTDAAKLDELTELLGQLITSGKRAVIFSHWEQMSSAVVTILKKHHVSYVRYYDALGVRRREVALERFVSDPSVQVLVVTDTPLTQGPVVADYLIHTDLPWNPALLTWRRQQVSNGGNVLRPLVELAVLGAETLEEAQWVLPAPAEPAPLEAVEEEDPTRPDVPLFGIYGQVDDGAHLARLEHLLEVTEKLRQTLASPSDITDFEVDPDEEFVQEAPPKPVVTPPAAPDSAQTADVAPAQAADTATDAAASPASEAPHAADSAHSESTHAAHDHSTHDHSAHDHAAHDHSAHDHETLDQVLHDLEVPLKAANRIIAGVPVVGESISKAGGMLWESLASRLRGKR